MTEKYLMVSLEEEKSKALAEVLSNSTARKILEYLTKHEGTAVEIANALSLALNTVTYNLKHLMTQDLIEAKSFQWSPKGRKQEIYTLKKKYIVIMPGKTDSNFLETLKKILPLCILGFAVGSLIEYFSLQTSQMDFALKTLPAQESVTLAAQEVISPGIIYSYWGIYFFLGVLFALSFYLLFLRKREI